MRTLTEVVTPALLIAPDRLERNLQRMQRRADELKVRLRPHVKTHKCLPIARRQLALGAQGLTVSTLKEADYFHEHGMSDILYAVSLAPNKFAHAQRLLNSGCHLTVIVDSAAAAAALADFGQASGQRFDVMIEIDTDGHRSGVRPDDPLLLEVARALTAKSARLAGVMTHAGSSYHANGAQALREVAEQERAGCVLAAERLRQAGHECPEVSVGSTPTALSAAALDGVTELRAGVYAFFDLVMLNLGVCERDDLALSVLTSVIGHQPDKGWIIVDAGWMAMSRDRGTQSQARDWGYGALCDPHTGAWLDGLRFTQANQEHGIIEAVSGVDVRREYPVGTLLQVMPNHACATAAQFPDYLVVGEGAVPAERWERLYGW